MRQPFWFLGFLVPRQFIEIGHGCKGKDIVGLDGIIDMKISSVFRTTKIGSDTGIVVLCFAESMK